MPADMLPFRLLAVWRLWFLTDLWSVLDCQKRARTLARASTGECADEATSQKLRRRSCSDSRASPRPDIPHIAHRVARHPTKASVQGFQTVCNLRHRPELR